MTFAYIRFAGYGHGRFFTWNENPELSPISGIKRDCYCKKRPSGNPLQRNVLFSQEISKMVIFPVVNFRSLEG